MQIFARGVIVTNNLTASDSISGYGAQISNNYNVNAPKIITLNGVNTFNNNYNRGLNINSYGAITVNNVTAIANGVSSNQYGVFLSNNGALPTKPAAITIKGNNLFGNNGSTNLYVTSLGAITANNVSAHSSVNLWGALLDNAAGNAAVALTGSNYFFYNFNSGLIVLTKGAITISNLTASNNAGGSAVNLDNTASTSASPKPVTLNGYVELHNNTATYALSIETYGAVITNNLNAIGNVNGVFVNQNPATAVTPANYSMKGVNKFIGNSGVGFSVQSLGIVTLSSVTASQNFLGGSINTAFTGSVGNVVLNGSNVFSNNAFGGLQIQAAGTVTINNITANANSGGMGVEINNTFLGDTMPKAVKFTGTNYFNNNGSTGLYISSHGTVTLNNINANENLSSGVYINGSAASGNTAHVTLTGKNQINNNGSINIFVLTKGNITISNLTANQSASGQGAYLYNDYVGTINGVTISGVNSFTNNSLGGLVIYSNGAVTMSKITADGNGGAGIFAQTDAAIALTCVSVINNNNYGLTLS
ncbi:MAG: beta strand repeat-containing protein, partial [Anaerolineales bacterium]